MTHLIKVIEENLPQYYKNLHQYQVADSYYNNQNDILRRADNDYQKQINPFRSANNRISHNWFNLLVNQKVGYMFTYAPTIDLNDDALNEKILDILGDKFTKVLKDLCIEASCFGKAYLHIWNEGRFNFINVPATQIIPIYSDNLNKHLSKVVRIYEILENSKNITVYELWDDKYMYLFKNTGKIVPFKKFGNNHCFEHNLGFLPFIEFSNNNIKSSDLINVKSLIDVYDKVFSGFVDDIDDIQQVILVLTNYGGEDLHTFLSDLKRYKAIDLQSEESDSKSGISTMSIDIPIEARCEVLKMTRKQIFVSGAGVDPENDNFSTTSGVALKHLYGLLELKAGLLESEFRVGINTLVQCILKYLNVSKQCKIEQTYYRDYIQNDLEISEILYKIKDFTSRKTLAKNNPFVDDFTEEIKNLSEEQNETDA